MNRRRKGEEKPTERMRSNHKGESRRLRKRKLDERLQPHGLGGRTEEGRAQGK